MPSSSDSSTSLSVVGSTQRDFGDTCQLCVYFNMLGGEIKLVLSCRYVWDNAK